ncbi:MAG: hypothetical protein A2788_01420 [Candidatus Abawacabacteria bacterium RIFCSPHIGHO2_01_FULL_46_8]|uniref:Uncharacterized protein n=1 Tax=Candidatus Abawacabacteria bacterium RIFCSPHIGHO2_01_FULL_46_8 TaxID=1817815 RepID=A0A1F4XN29_9BACT|nr:MAG: hypothetical protein A2788_01420 [Candidatus Abawacabacteria bacterium RIFCSPHIGHO2_01_FULL_46_8]
MPGVLEAPEALPGLERDELVAELSDALGDKFKPSDIGEKFLSQNMLEEAGAKYGSMAEDPQRQEEFKRLILKDSLARVSPASAVIESARDWTGRALALDHATKPEEEEELTRAISNFETLACSRRYEQMEAMSKSLVNLLNMSLSSDNRAKVIAVANRFLVYQPESEIAADQTEPSELEKRRRLEQQAKFADLRNELLGKLLLQLEPAKLISPKSADEPSVGLDPVEIKEGLPQELLKAESNLLVTIGTMSPEQLKSFTKQLTSADHGDRAKQIDRLDDALVKIRQYRDAVQGTGSFEKSAIMARNEELADRPNLALKGLNSNIAFLEGSLGEAKKQLKAA